MSGERRVGVFKTVPMGIIQTWWFPQDAKALIWEGLDAQIRRHCDKQGYDLLTEISHHEIPSAIPDSLDESTGLEEWQIIFHATVIVRKME